MAFYRYLLGGLSFDVGFLLVFTWGAILSCWPSIRIHTHYTQIHKYTYTHTHINTYAHTHLHTNTHRHIHTYTHTHIHIHIYHTLRLAEICFPQSIFFSQIFFGGVFWWRTIYLQKRLGNAASPDAAPTQHGGHRGLPSWHHHDLPSALRNGLRNGFPRLFQPQNFSSKSLLFSFRSPFRKPFRKPFRRAFTRS